MRTFKIFLLTSLLFLLMCCRPKPECNMILEVIQESYGSGNFRNAIRLTDSLKKMCPDNKQIVRKADSLAEIAERIIIDYSVTKEQVIKQIEQRTGSLSKDDISTWENRGWLECRMINGEKMYFNRAVSNLQLLRQFHEQKEEGRKRKGEDPAMSFRLKHTRDVYRASENRNSPAVPVNMIVIYTITVRPDAVPEGEIIRCWLPYPGDKSPRQKNIELLSTSNPEFIVAPDSAVHSTIYMEGVSVKGISTLFNVSYRYQSSGQHFNLEEQNILPYDKESDIYQKYTKEQHPHICFTGNIKRLADSITTTDDNPSEVVRKIYSWFKETIPWTGAPEYSIMPNIPEYVFENKRGDCGMQTFMFMSMLRYKGIPVRWQSGWMVPEVGRNLHDWCEVYYEGTGWVPVDISYDLQQSENKAIREFYLSGIDSYRLIVNDGVAGALHPEKLYMRSEPYDFQRGEVEWKGGNLYFDKWDYDMKIEYEK